MIDRSVQTPPKMSQIAEPTSKDPESPSPKYLRSIEMPFTLLNVDHTQRTPSPEESLQILSIFPGATHLRHFPPHLIIVLNPLPEQPLPAAIAGVPCYFTTEETDLGPLAGNICSGPDLFPHMKLPLWQLPDYEMRVKILEQLIPVGVRSLGWAGTRWIMFDLDSSPEIHLRLPRTIAGIISTYMLFDVPREPALRKLFPISTLYDNSDYFPNMHAGMMLATTDGTFSTSGVPLMHESTPGETFFTLASHGFLNTDDVLHPSPAVERIVGKVENRLRQTDIAIARLHHSEITYTSETFAGPDGTISLKKLVPLKDTYAGQELFFDSPFTGFVQGYVYLTETRAIPTDDPTIHPWSYVANLWVNFANQLVDPVEGCCGSPIWDKDGGIHAFFGYYADSSGISYCPSPDPIIQDGYDLKVDDA